MVNNPILKLPNQKPLAFISHLCSSINALNLSDCLSSRQQHLCDRGLDPGFISGKNVRVHLHSNVEETNIASMEAKQNSSCTHIVRKSIS